MRYKLKYDDIMLAVVVIIFIIVVLWLMDG